MPQATDAQVQRFANERVRPRAEQLIRLLNAVTDDRGAIDDIYDRLVNGAPWNDNREDGPPQLLTGSDVLAYNTFVANMIAFMQNDPQWAVVRSAAVNGLTV
jgi:hypothetical protein